MLGQANGSGILCNWLFSGNEILVLIDKVYSFNNKVCQKYVYPSGLVITHPSVKTVLGYEIVR